MEVHEECKRCAEFIGNNNGDPYDYNGECEGSETGCLDFIEMMDWQLENK